MALALQVSLAMEICYVLMHALRWPDLLTGAITTVITDQSSLGASVPKRPDAGAARADRAWIGRLAADAQAVFLALLALIRHRLAPEFPGLPPDARAVMMDLDRDVADTLAALADRVEGKAPRPLPDLASRVGALERLTAAPAAPGRGDGAVRTGELDHVAPARCWSSWPMRDAVLEGPSAR